MYYLNVNLKNVISDQEIWLTLFIYTFSIFLRVKIYNRKKLCIQYTIRYRPNPMSETRRKMHDCINIFFRFFPPEGSSPVPWFHILMKEIHV